ncbi:MAG TPA: thioredoxin family protein, partial [Kofleriaceae bacterium]|nr:thioredoxin family protein [Kofleriaceae bacterium]
GVGDETIVHDQRISLGELRMAAEVGVAEDIGIALSIPLRMVDTSIRYLDGGGQEVDIAGADLHHRNETLVGVVDPWVLGHWHQSMGRWSIDVRGGLSVPLGRTEEDPFALGDAGMRHQHIQFGTGTFNPVVGAEVARDLGPLALRAYALTQQVLYENDKGYRAGDRYGAGLGALSPLGTRRWRFELGGEVQGETAEEWNGVRHEDDGNRGRVDVLASAAIGRSLGAGIDGFLGVKVPVYTHVVGGQLEYPVVIELGVSRLFELGGHEEEEHGHSHEEEHSHAEEAPPAGGVVGAADVVDLTDTGEAVELDPVAGKVTVFDFWATWCVPCRELDARLRELARRHPDRLAIRRINVVDWDSPAAERYLTPGGFNLPHLVVKRADGSLALEKSAPPAELVADVERLLRE